MVKQGRQCARSGFYMQTEWSRNMAKKMWQNSITKINLKTASDRQDSTLH